MPNTATRLINLIMLLQRRPGQKAGELAGELGVSVRTLHRYFSMLDEMGIPVYSERGPYGGFSLVRGYKLPPLVFTPEEAVAVLLGVNLVEEMWGRLYREAAHGALAKLENVLPDEQRHEIAWARRTLFATGFHRSDLQVLGSALEIIRGACREHRKLNIIYQSSGNLETSERVVRPYGLVYRWGWWYLVAYCEMRAELRTFRVDRMIGLNLLEQLFDLPENFDLKAFLGKQPRVPEVEITMRFQAEFAGVAFDNRTSWKSMETQADGTVVVTYLSPQLEWGVSMALGYGPIVEVLEPPEARQKIADWAQSVFNQYQAIKNTGG